VGYRGRFAYPLSARHPPLPNPGIKHRFRCRECGTTFTAFRDDARFCSARCRQRNCRRRGSPPAATDAAVTFLRDLEQKMKDIGA
jgi:hypothetical protein